MLELNWWVFERLSSECRVEVMAYMFGLATGVSALGNVNELDKVSFCQERRAVIIAVDELYCDLEEFKRHAWETL